MGPSVVQLNTKAEVGNFFFSSDRLGINSQENFSTIRANACVYEGDTKDVLPDPVLSNPYLLLTHMHTVLEN